MDILNSNPATVITESAESARGVQYRKETGEVLRETKSLVEKCRTKKVSRTVSQTQSADLSKLINSSKVSTLCTYNMVKM